MFRHDLILAGAIALLAILAWGGESRFIRSSRSLLRAGVAIVVWFVLLFGLGMLFDVFRLSWPSSSDHNAFGTIVGMVAGVVAGPAHQLLVWINFYRSD